MAYKYPEAWRFLAELMIIHIPGELQEFLAADMEFSELRMAKIEVDHPVPYLDLLRVSLETRNYLL